MNRGIYVLEDEKKEKENRRWFIQRINLIKRKCILILKFFQLFLKF